MLSFDTSAQCRIENEHTLPSLARRENVHQDITAHLGKIAMDHARGGEGLYDWIRDEVTWDPDEDRDPVPEDHVTWRTLEYYRGFSHD